MLFRPIKSVNKNQVSMKRVFVLAMAAISLAACENTSTTATNEDTTTVTTNTTTDNAAYAPSEGDVTRKDGKVMVMRNGEWVEADSDVELDNDVVVYKDGRVVRDGKEVELEEGEVVNKTGDFFDRSGRAIENAWQDAKEGVKEAGKDVKDAVKDAGRKLDNAVDNDKDGQ
jgi:predicted small secreted protein